VDSVSLAEDKKLDRFLKGLIMMSAAWVLLGHGSNILRVLIAFPYPTYRSLKAILSDTKEDDIACLRYWVVFALFCCAEVVLDIVLGLMPLFGLYSSLKLIMILWLMAPIPLNGTDLVFHKVILPLFQEHESKLDELAELTNLQANKLINNSRATAEDALKKTF